MKSLARILILIVLFAALDPQVKAEDPVQIYFEDWEPGPAGQYSMYDGWFSKYYYTISEDYDPIELVTDDKAPSPSIVHQITRVDAASNYLSPLIEVTEGQSYRVSAWIKWESGGWPFVGVSRYNEYGNPMGLPLYDPCTAPRLIWLIGKEDYHCREGYEPPGGLVTSVPIMYGWRRYENEFTVPAGTAYVRIMTELWAGASREGQPLGYFDNIAMWTVPAIFFVEPPTPANGADIESSQVQIKTKILESPALTDVTFYWDEEGYTLYDSSLVLMFNFDNVLALGEDYDGGDAEAGDLVKDVSLQGNDGYLSDELLSPDKVPEWFSYGRYGGAFDFIGNGIDTGQSILVYHSDSLNPGSGDFAIVFWILTRDDYDGDVLRKGSTNTAATWYKVEHAPSGPADYISLNFNTDGTDATINSSSEYKDNRWHFVLAQRNGTRAELWIDGALDGAAPVTGTISNTANLAIGSKDTQNDDFMNSALDEVRLYMRSFTPGQIQQLYYSNLAKYDLDKWALYVNQSNMTDGTYTYQTSATNTSGPLLTETRSLIVELPYVPLKGPYLQNAAPDSIVIMWETDTQMGSRVDYGIAAPNEFYVEDPTPVTIHEIELTGLAAHTTYYYNVTCDGLTSATSTFQTAPAMPRSFRFAVYGDSRTYPDDHIAVVEGIINSEPEIVLHTGDMVTSGAYSEWADEFFTPAHGLIMDTPILPVLGNHENNSSWYYDFFSLPDNGSTTGNNERWYAFTYGSVRFIALDTNADYTPGSEQYNWLESELLSADYINAVWHIVFFHHPPYTASSGHSDDSNVKSYLVPLFEQYGVDMVFSGHTHAYERYYNNGIYYIVTGGGGAPLHNLLEDTEPPIRQFGESVYHHCVIDVGAASGTLTLRARDNHGQEFDTITLPTPDVTLVSPEDESVVNTTNVSFTCSATDKLGLQSATLYIGSGPQTASFTGSTETDDAQLYQTDDPATAEVEGPDTNAGSAVSINVDGHNPHAHAVIKFPNLIGTGAGQVPPGSAITSATLEINCSNLGNVMKIYRLIEDWVESEVTWNQRSSGLAWSDPGADGSGSNAGVALDGDCTATGWRTIDITPFVQQWSDGSPNYGIVLTDTGTDGVDFYSSESGNPPVLTITYGQSDWQPYQTKPMSGTSDTVTFDPVTLEEGDYVWNCLVTNTSSQQSWAPGDYHLTVDTTAPVISDVSSSDITDTTATITWTTDELSNSLVRYDTSTPPTTEASDAAMLTSHAVTLTGLSPETTYYYEVQSTDEAGNTAIDDNGGAYYSFTTQPTGPTTLFNDGFESGDFAAGGWTASSQASVDPSAAYEGSYGALLKKTSWIEKAVSTSGYQNIKIQYARKTSGLDEGEFLEVSWFDGSAWQQLEATQDSYWNSVEFTPAGASDNTNFKIKFTLNGNAGKDIAMVDEVAILGTPIASGSGTKSASGTMHVDSIVVSFINLGGGMKKGRAQVVIADNNNRPVSGAAVTGTFSEDISETVGAVTDENGIAVLESTVTAKGRCLLTFTVDSVRHNEFAYVPGDNVQTSGNNHRDGELEDD